MTNTTETKQRVVNELQDLQQKIVKLSLFLFSTKTLDLKISKHQLNLMGDQLRFMQDYARILISRLACWDLTDEEIYQSNYPRY